MTSLEKAITVGEMVYVHVEALSNDKLSEVYSVHLQRCSIFDSNGANEIVLIKDNQPVRDQTHVETITTPGRIGHELSEPAVFAFQGQSDSESQIKRITLRF